ncbi:MAG: glycosyltransferase [Alteraurantiacibacter sp.]
MSRADASTTPRLLLTTAGFDPSFGGPAQSVPRLGIEVARQGWQVGFWAPDGSASLLRQRFDLPGGVTLFEGSAEDALDSYKPDLLHDNGIWLPYSHTLANLAAKRALSRVVSIRGMLEPWSMKHKALKKRLAWHLYQKRDLQKAALLHVTAKQEEKAVAAWLPGARMVTVPNAVDLPASVDEAQRDSDPRLAFYIGRIHPKKGLSMLVEAWAKARPEGWRLHISGPDEAGETARLQSLVTKHGLADRIAITGASYGADKDTLFCRASLFVLPTYSENFGIVVAEALAFGIPVLTTTGTPWQELQEQDCGWWVAPETDAIEAALREATAADPAALAAMGARGRALVERDYSWQQAASDMIEAYRNLFAKREGAR